MESRHSISVPDAVKKNRGKIIQIVMCAIGNMATLSSGMNLGFSAVALPYMLQPNDTLYINSEQASWIASLTAIVTPIGCLISGPILDRFGRRKSIMLVNVPFVIGWLLIAIQPSLMRVYIGRILTGIGTGLSSIPATVYAAEIASQSLRGLLVSGTSIAIALGVAVTYILGLYLQENWQLIALVSAVYPMFACLLIYMTLPESPVWLLTRGKYEEAGHALRRLRGASHLQEVQLEMDTMTEKGRTKRKQSASLASTISAMARPETIKPLIIMNTFFFFQQFTGIFVVIFYAVDIVKEAGVSMDAFVVTVIIGIARFFVTILAAWSSKRFGRRPTAILSGVGMSISLLALAIHLYHQHADSFLLLTPPSNATVNATDPDVIVDRAPTVSWIPITSILAYIFASTIGFHVLPWSMIGEVYPAQVRGVASGLTTSIAYVFSFITIKLYPEMLEVLHQHGVFFFYGLMAVLGTIFVVLFLPETQGKTLYEIEQYFRKGKKQRNETEEEMLHQEQGVSIVRLPPTTN